MTKKDTNICVKAMVAKDLLDIFGEKAIEQTKTILQEIIDLVEKK